MYTVIYDGNCNLCVTLVQLLEKLDRGQQFGYVAMQDEATLAQFDISAADCEMGMILIAPDTAEGSADAPPAKRWQGSDAAEEIGRLLPMGAVFVQAYRALPGAKFSGDRTYEFIRDNRYQLFGKRDQTYTASYPACDSDSCNKSF
ncbi:MAG: DCC1-like thiol-disulfide oxidoreductase family protein [Cyanobacteria bacterium J06598_1]